MQDIFQYLLKWSIALGAVYLFYFLVLRPLTFYQWNRKFLIAYSIITFFIPFVNLYSYVQPTELQQIRLVNFIPVVTINENVTGLSSGSAFNPLLVAASLILTGSIVLMVRLTMQWYSLRRIRRIAQQVYHPSANLYHVDENIIPFSFGENIYVNMNLHSDDELNDIILHEFVHVKQKHSFDIIWSEILCILNWYNPFAWLIRHAIRQNLEFIADQAVLNHGLDKKTYQYHLLKVIGSSQYSIANNFNFSSLKKRIAMMNRLKTARVHLVKFLFVLPLLAVLLVAFRTNQGRYQDTVDQVLKTDTIAKPDKEALERVKSLMQSGQRFIPISEFYRQHPSVKEVAWSSDEEIVIYLRNGTREVYNSRSADDLKKLSLRYHGLPAVFPMYPSKVIPPPVEERVQPDPVFQAKVNEFYKRNTGVQAILWKENNVIVKNKDGSVEAFNYTDVKQMDRFNNKFGEMPEPPPGAVSIPSAPEPMLAPGHPPVPQEPKLPKGVSSVRASNNIVTLFLTNGTTEKYNLNKPAEKAALEKKYGEVMVLPDVPIEQSLEERVYIPSVIIEPTEQKTSALEPVITVAAETTIPVPVWPEHAQKKTSAVYYVDGKKITEQNPQVISNTYKISQAEVVTDIKDVRTIGETKHNAVINLITTENLNNQSAYLFQESKKLVEKSSNVLQLGVETEIDINITGIPDSEIVVTMTGGKLLRRDGKYYAVPEVTGKVEVRVFREVDNQLKFLNNKVYKVKAPQ